MLIKDIKLNKLVKNDTFLKYANIIDKPRVKTLSTDRSEAMVMCGLSNTALNLKKKNVKEFCGSAVREIIDM